MCNLYSLVTPQALIRERMGVEHDRTGNLPPLPGIFPDQMAPVVRQQDGARELAMMRWGFPSPANAGPQHPVTNMNLSYRISV
jgi:putative SOS response-associated peptidase YedK